MSKINTQQTMNLEIFSKTMKNKRIQTKRILA